MNRTTFWYEKENEKNGNLTLCIDQAALMQMVHGNGFRKYYRETDVLYMRLNGGILNQVTQSEIRTFVGDYVATMPQDQLLSNTQISYPTHLWQLILARTAQYFSAPALDHLQLLQPNPVCDTLTESYFFFANGVVRVSAGDTELKPYASLSGRHVWQSQIRPHEISLQDGGTADTDICDFFSRVSNHNAKRFRSLMCNVGYCLHRHKKGESKMVFFMDESPETTSEGGTGKGILLECIRNMRESVVFNGKMMDFKSPFLWQRVDNTTEIIEIDELPEKFDFGKLFALATSGIEINKKGLKAFYIPDERAPKFVWATNYATKGIGDSYERRQSIVPLYRAFDLRNRPVDVYGKLFFSDWNESEWNGFHIFMITCCQTFLKHGLCEWTSDVMREKQVNSEVDEDYQSLFETFVTGLATEDAPTYNRSDVLAQYRTSNPFQDSQTKTIGKELLRSLNAWCRLRGYIIVHRNSNGNRLFQILGKVQ